MDPLTVRFYEPGSHEVDVLRSMTYVPNQGDVVEVGTVFYAVYRVVWRWPLGSYTDAGGAHVTLLLKPHSNPLSVTGV